MRMKTTVRFSLCLNKGDEVGITTSENTPEVSPRNDDRTNKSKRSFERIHPIRQLPCRTFLSCGSCAYGDDCDFLHDERLRYHGFVEPYIFNRYSLKHNNNGNIQDGLFWPTMSMSEVLYHRDSKGLPAIQQHYHVPTPFIPHIDKNPDESVARPPPSCSTNRSKQTVYSTWNYFTLFLEHQNVFGQGSDYSFPDVDFTITGRPRLSVFRALAEQN